MVERLLVVKDTELAYEILAGAFQHRGNSSTLNRLHVIEYSPCNNCWPDEPVKSSFIASRSLDMLKKFHCVLIATPVYQS